MNNPEEAVLWEKLYKAGRVPLPELPSNVSALIRAIDDIACRPGLEILMKVLSSSGEAEAHTAIRRWVDDPDPELADSAFRKLGGVPLHPWSDAILQDIAVMVGHPRRYEAMLAVNALSLRRPLFLTALQDADPNIRSAGYSSLAIAGRLEHVIQLSEGLEDLAAEVREHVVDLLIDLINGSDIDERAPLLERRWTDSEQAGFNALRERLVARLKTLAELESGRLKGGAVSGLISLDPAEAARHLLEMAKSEDPTERAQAALFLGLYPGSEFWEALTALANETSVSVRRNVVIGLYKVKDKAKAIAALGQMLKTETDETVRLEIAEALSFLRSEEISKNTE